MHFDVVVIGAGSAGAALAGLLSEKSSRRVLLVEAGEDYRSAETPPEIQGPNFDAALRLGRFHYTSLTASLSEAQPSSPYLAGRGVGGSSAINGQGATRALPSDFDRWAQNGCTGWSWKEVLPSFVRLEHDHGFDASFHGRRGPIPIVREARSTWGSVSTAMMEAAMACGHLWSGDINAPDSTGVSPIAWNRLNGKRVSTNDAYLEPARARSNLTVRGNTTVERVLFSGQRAIGVQLRTPEGQANVEAAEVIVAAGALHSPAILMRSGVGPSDELRKHGIPVVANVPGVGKNLQEHPMVWLMFPLKPSARAMSPEILPCNSVLRFADDETGNVNAMQIMPLERTPMEVDKGGFMVSFLRPSSRGNVRLASPDPNTQPLADFRMLSSNADVRGMRRALRQTAMLSRTAPLASIIEGKLGLAPERAIDALDDQALDTWIMSNSMPHYHASGTCRMGTAADPSAVVDSHGRVRGVEGLRVIDASIMPDLPTAGTHLTTVMLAEHIHAMTTWRA